MGEIAIRPPYTSINLEVYYHNLLCLASILEEILKEFFEFCFYQIDFSNLFHSKIVYVLFSHLLKDSIQSGVIKRQSMLGQAALMEGRKEPFQQ